MDEPMSDFHFHAMTLMFRFRDFFSPRRKVMEETGIKPGFLVLDYGCGPGSYIPTASEMVGPSGKVYALDIHPHAIEMVRNLASIKNLTNVETILSDCATGLPPASLDAVLFYDTFHALSEPEKILKELRHVLKPGGILSFSDHHMREEEIMEGITKGGFFRLKEKGKKTYTFEKK
ncbi:class I SAM-dependent methyltransferase [Methanosarcina sp. KYL-1]|uniref:class I SAM-dependent methyltransferase n=1 Tax=Methanosarcina sp. KYL-1 TaxID=2602068 RepID=UPI002101969F|nr:class I SAM-dependent methyltransferase [Methanosarcina sp. KYL-1]MCQ1536500.1 class I SAM-dependent methyltransferase [Methanosarcina sp. KYL-1]